MMSATIVKRIEKTVQRVMKGLIQIREIESADDLKVKLEVAAEKLADEYMTNPELTAFVSLDGEDIREEE